MNLRSLRPAYFFKRLAQWRFEKAHPHLPWLAESAIVLLDAYLKPTDLGFEWGSGRSTLWFAQRVAHLYSIEDNPRWHEQIRDALIERNLVGKVTYRFIPCEHREVDEPDRHPYAEAARTIPDDSLDFALVDGNIRAACVGAILPKLKAGGLLILDNANRYLPNGDANGHTTVHEPRREVRTAAWRNLAEQLADWRWMNTTNGIWDTGFWIKPAEILHPAFKRPHRRNIAQELALPRD
jgi:hypothetical protein